MMKHKCEKQNPGKSLFVQWWEKSVLIHWGLRTTKLLFKESLIYGNVRIFFFFSSLVSCHSWKPEIPAPAAMIPPVIQTWPQWPVPTVPKKKLCNPQTSCNLPGNTMTPVSNFNPGVTECITSSRGITRSPGAQVSDITSRFSLEKLKRFYRRRNGVKMAKIKESFRRTVMWCKKVTFGSFLEWRLCAPPWSSMLLSLHPSYASNWKKYSMASLGLPLPRLWGQKGAVCVCARTHCGKIVTISSEWLGLLLCYHR